MRFRFRGTRGSLPAPGLDTVRYGGNTTCIEVRSDNDDLIILDAGTGIRQLGRELAASSPFTCHIFITHTHWDHIHGLPFFTPLFISGNSVLLYGPPDPVAMVGIEGVLSMQLQYPYFPITPRELAANISSTTLTEGEVVDLGFASVQPILLNHPAMDYGYKIICDGKTLFFTGDHEAHYNIYNPGDADFDDYQTSVDERVRELEAFLADVDVMIADGQYTRDEYTSHQGWGHSCQDDVLDLARRAGVDIVYLTHHETSRTDDELDALGEQLGPKWEERGVVAHLARENEEITV